MIIATIKEGGDSRVALTPKSIKKLLGLEGLEIYVQKGLSLDFSDEEYEKAGAKMVSTEEEALKEADIYVGVQPLEESKISLLKKGAFHITHLDPFNQKPLIDNYAKAGVNSISMEMIPRTTLAQKMDALSSQASLAGYVAVLLAANRLNKILPMMMTPAGTIPPSRVFVIGAGVAGLQAIATAKRMGARVDAFDTRPVVEEQVNSLGAKFLKVDLGEMGQTKDGYAKELTPEQLEKQQEAMIKQCSLSDIVITTAKLFGRKAPVVIKKETLKQMKSGSVVVDLAVGTGGNVEGSEVDKTVTVEGVDVIGIDNLPGEVSIDASEMYASNLVNLLTHVYDKEQKTITFDREDEIVKAILITQGGEWVNERINEFYKEKK